MQAKFNREIKAAHAWFGHFGPSLSGQLRLFADLTPGQLVLVPYCQYGVEPLAAVLRGGRVVTGTLDLAGLRALLRPMSVPGLRQALNRVRQATSIETVEERIAAETSSVLREALMCVLQRIQVTGEEVDLLAAFGIAGENLIALKQLLNSRLSTIKLTDDAAVFRAGAADILLSEQDPFDLVEDWAGEAARVVFSSGLEECWSEAAQDRFLEKVRAALPSHGRLVAAPVTPNLSMRLMNAGWEVCGCDILPEAASDRTPEARWFVVAASGMEPGDAGEDMGETRLFQTSALGGYFSVGAFLADPAATPLDVARLSLELTPPALQESQMLNGEKMAASAMAESMETRAANWRALCGALLRAWFSGGDWQFFCTAPERVKGEWGRRLPRKKAECGEVFSAWRGDLRVLFFFADDWPEPDLIAAETRGRHLFIHILPEGIAAADADPHPGVWQLAFDDLRRFAGTRQAELVTLPTAASDAAVSAKAREKTLTVVKNQIVDATGDCWKLVLRTGDPVLGAPMPGQFIMLAAESMSDQAGIPLLPGERRPYLKRPFGLYQVADQSGVGDEVLKHLPAGMAGVLRPVFFVDLQLVYRVRERGAGTRALTRLRSGDRLRVLGPLGNGLDCFDVRQSGVTEVHLIGGGVGMAPLVFMAQMLVRAGIRVRAFLGVECAAQLSAASGVDEQREYLYLDTLRELGVAMEDLSLSLDRTVVEEQTALPVARVCPGFVSDLYATVLRDRPVKGKALAFACGPTPMMRATADVAAAAGVPLKVLLEKRMACGIGVCLSCVCRTQTGSQGYSRVCTDGPIFDAKEILWN